MAAKNIKGITVEIGGDTTKLNDALQTSDKSLRNTEKELKEVEKLLKLDPGNTVLLAQKYELLSKKVEDSKNTLDKLKEVQEQVETQFKNGEIGEEQYRAFNRELEAAEINARNAQTALDRFGNEAEQTGNEVEKAGNKTEKSKKTFATFGETLKKAFALTAVIAGVKKLGEAVLSVATDSAAYADNILTLATNTGIAAADLQAYSYAAELIDVSLDTLTGSMAKNIKSMSSAAKGSKEMQKAYKTLGVSVKDSNGNLRDSETVYWELIDSLGNVENETQRDALAMQIFGKSAQELNSLIATGSDGVRAYADEAKSMGAVLSGNALDSLGELDDAIQRTKSSSATWKNQIGAQVAPTVTRFLTGLQQTGKNALPTIKNLVRDGVNGLTKIGTKLKPVFDVGKRLLTAIKNGVQPVLKDLEPLVDSVLGLFSTLGKVILPIVKGAFQVLEPIVRGISDALSTVVGWADSIISFFTGVNTEAYELGETISDTTDRWNELSDAANASVSENLAAIKPLEDARKRLDDVFDANGNLIGSEQEAIRLIGVLEQAGIDVDYNSNTKRIEGYKELGKQIDNVIAKTKLQAYVDASQDQYTEAIKNQQQSYKDAADALALYREAVKENGKNSIEAAGAWKTYQEALENTAKAEKVVATVDTAAGLASEGDFEGAINAYKNYYAEVAYTTDEGERTAYAKRKEYLGSAVELVDLFGNALTTGNQNLIDGAYEQFETAVNLAREQGAELPEGFAEGVKNNEISVSEAIDVLNDAMNEKFVFGKSQAAAAGEQTGRSYGEAILSADGTVKYAGQRLTGITNAEFAKTNARKLGQDAGQGFANGILDKLGAVTSAAARIAKKAAEAIQKAQNSHSPSKVTQKLGDYFGEGYAVGISDKVREVQNASSRLVASAVAPVSNTSSIVFNTKNTFTGASARDGATLIRQVNRQLGSIYGGRA